MAHSKEQKAIIQAELDAIGEEADLEIIKKLKIILNTSFGEAHNQIKKVDIEYISRRLGSSTDLKKATRDWTSINAYYFIYVHFPEVIITNSRKESLLLKDLYVRIKLRSNGTMGMNIEGFRATISEDEYHAQYFHSHLSNFSPSEPNFLYFCTGEGPINQIMLLLSKKFDEINMKLFCLHLKSFVAWESIEGMPYNYIIDVGAGEHNVADFDYDVFVEACRPLIDILKTYPTNQLKELFKVSINSTGIELQKTDGLEEKLGAIILNSSKHLHPYLVNMDLLSIKSTDGRYFRANSGGSNPTNYSKTPVFTFKGSEISLTVENLRNEKEKKYYAHPKLTTTLCKQLSRILTKEIIASGINIWKKDTSRNISTVTSTDEVPVLGDLGGRVVRDTVLSSGGDIRDIPF